MKISGRKLTAVALSLLISSNLLTPALARQVQSAEQKLGSGPLTKVVPPALKSVRFMGDRNPKKWGSKRPVGTPTLLDEVGRMKRPLAKKELAKWRSELMAKSVSRSRKFQIRIWIAEFTMRVEENPQLALEMIRRLADDVPARHPLRGLVETDLGIILMANGRYNEARRTFGDLLDSGLSNYDQRIVMLWSRHAISCAGYHDRRREAGITEPTHIDPLCGASSIAIALRHLGRNHDKEVVAKATPHTGFGSSMEDLERAAENLGLVGRTVSIRNESLIDFFKINGGVPMVAHIERDHFVAVTGADSKGVTYWCSDCGPWPGGSKTVTWKQWELMEASAYLAMALPETDFAKSLQLLGSTEQAPNVDNVGANVLLASLAPTPRVVTPGSIQIATKLTLLGVAQYFVPWWFDCGQMPWNYHCNGCSMAPTYAGAGSAVTEDPINLANGSEEYTAGGGLTVYNPIGPSVHWTHHYNSLAQTVPNGWGMGWYHSYLTTIWLQEVDSMAGDSGGFIQLANSARIDYSFQQPGAPSSGQTWTATFAESGHMYRLQWKNTSGVQSMELLDPGRTKFYFEKKITAFGDASRWYLVKIQDKTGHFITLQWAAMELNEVDAMAQSYDGYVLTAIKDEADATLLELDYEDGRLLTATDCYDRRIYYAHDEFESVGQSPGYWHDELTEASIVYDVNDTLPPSGPVARYMYTYYDHNSGGALNPSGEKVAFLKTISALKPNGSGYATAEISYDDFWYVESVEDGNGVVTTFEIVESGSPPVPQPEVKVKVMDGTTVVYQYQVLFDVDMNWNRIKDASGDTVVELTFSTGGTTFRPSRVTDGNNRQWDLTWNSSSQLLSVETPKGTTKTLTRDTTYNPFGDVTAIAVNGKTSTQIDYFTNGLVDEVRTPIPGEQNTGNRQATNFTYNTYGDLLTIVSPGNNAGSTKTVTLDYDSTPKKGQPVSVTDPNGNETTYTYTDRGRVETVTDADGNTHEATYNIVDQVVKSYLPATGNTGSLRSYSENVYAFPGGYLLGVNAYDENEDLHRSVAYTYGNEGELLTKTGSTEPVTLTYTNLYDVETVSDGGAHTTSYTYNTDGLLTQIDYPNASGANFDRIKFTSYDVVGNLLTRVDGRGQTTAYEYSDTDGLLTDIDYAGTANDIAISYDSYGRVTSVTDAEGSSSASDYDDLDNILEASRTYTGLSAKTFTYSYYPDGSRDTLSTPAGDWEYLYDIGGRCTSLVSPAGTHTIDYFDNNWIQKRTLPNGTYTSYTYNEVGMPESLVSKDSSHNTLTSFGSFSYDGVFNMLGMSATYTGLSSFSGDTDWTYDTKDRLTQEASTRYGGWTDNNAFDGAFNPTTFKGNTRTYNIDNQLTTGSMTHDGNGNPTTYAGTTFTYDDENRITAVGSLLTCGYRADGLRAWKQGATGGKTYFLYDGGVPIIELDSSGNVANINVFAPDGLVGRKEGSTWTYYTFDQQGNVAQRLNSSQVVQTSRVFDAWGEGAETTLPRSIDCWNYNAQWGYYYDRETSLYYCQNRMYDASTGRWINRDPIGYAGGINLYGYCAGGPVGSIDPTGLEATLIGDIGQFIQGFGRASVDATIGLLTWPVGLPQEVGAFLADPMGHSRRAVEGLLFWNACNPEEMGYRFFPWGMALLTAGAMRAGGPVRLPIGKSGLSTNLKVEAAPDLPSPGPGSAGGPGAGRSFSRETKATVRADNPGNICVWCRGDAGTGQIDHIVARSRGGNNSRANAGLACPHCNASKGARDHPVTRPNGERYHKKEDWWP